MTDKNKTAATKATVSDKSKPVNISSSEVKSESKQPTNSTATAKINKSSVPKAKKSFSILAVIALILILLSWGILAYVYTLFDAQKNTFEHDIQAKINTHTRQQLVAQDLATKKLLVEQANEYEARLRNVNLEVAAQSQKTIDKLQRTVDQLSATKPSDWLIHEAQYLIRVAVRTLWLEKNTSAAISLLTDADNRLKELNDPSFLSVRQAIREDITRLQLLPQINTDDILLQLMALTTQVPQLSLATEDILAAQEGEDSLELSEDIGDWKANLAQTWQQFISDFITVRQHSANIEPLLSVEQKQNLLTNIKLKLQQAQWAASHGKEAVYRQTLVDIHTTVSEYFSEDAIVNQSFITLIDSLKDEKVAISYPSDLSAFDSINQAIEKKSVSHIEVLKTATSTQVVEEAVTEAQSSVQIIKDQDAPLLLDQNEPKPDEESLIQSEVKDAI